MKKLICLLSVLCFLISLSGCKIEMSNGPCEGVGPGESYICEIVPNPQDISLALSIANVSALKSNLYRAEQELERLDKFIETIKGEPVTVAEFYGLLSENVDPLYVVLIQEFEARFSGIENPLTEKDKEIVIGILNRQRVLIKLSIENREK